MASLGSVGGKKKCQDGAVYTQLADDEQIVVLQKVYAQCPHPSASQVLQMKRVFPMLNNVEDKQIRVWFQNRRSDEKLKRENSDIHSIKEKLTVTNKLLKDENATLMKKVTDLMSENDYLQQQLQDVKHF